MLNILPFVSFCRRIIRQDPRLIALARMIMWRPTINAWKRLISEMDCLPVHTASGRFLIITPDPYSIIGSLGDYAMIEALVAAAKKRSPAIKIAIVTGNEKADAAARKLGLTPLNIWAAAALPERLKQELMLFNPDIVAVMGADVMDGYYNSFFTLQQMMVADISTRLGARAFVSGFSFNNKPAKELKEIFNLVHPSVIFNVRDPASFANFTSFCNANAQLVADAAFSLIPSSGSRAESDMRGYSAKKAEAWMVLSVNLHPLLIKQMSQKQVDLMVKSVAAAIEHVSKQRKTVWVLTPHDYRGAIGDNVILRPLYDALKNRGVAEVHLLDGENSAADLKAAAVHINGVITARMHWAIACLGRGKPVLAITYQDKFRGLLQHFGLPEWLLTEPNALFDETAFAAKIIRFVDALPAFTSGVEQRLPQVLALSQKNFERIKS